MIYTNLRVFVNARNEKAVQRTSSRLRETLPLPMEVSLSQKYWKDIDLTEVSYSVDMRRWGDDIRGVVCEVLESAWMLGGPWTVTSIGGPFADGWEFEALAEKGRSRLVVPGIQWANFTIHFSLALSE